MRALSYVGTRQTSRKTQLHLFSSRFYHFFLFVFFRSRECCSLRRRRVRTCLSLSGILQLTPTSSTSSLIFRHRLRAQSLTVRETAAVNRWNPRVLPCQPVVPVPTCRLPLSFFVCFVFVRTVASFAVSDVGRKNKLVACVGVYATFLVFINFPSFLASKREGY